MHHLHLNYCTVCRKIGRFITVVDFFHAKIITQISRTFNFLRFKGVRKNIANIHPNTPYLFFPLCYL